MTQTPGPPRKYFFEYNITFRHVAAVVQTLEKVRCWLFCMSSNVIVHGFASHCVFRRVALSPTIVHTCVTFMACMYAQVHMAYHATLMLAFAAM